MVVIVLVVPSSSNGHDEPVQHHTASTIKYDVNNNHEYIKNLHTKKNHAAETYNYATRDYRKSNNCTHKDKNVKFYQINNAKNEYNDYHNNSNSYRNYSKNINNKNKSNACNKNFVRHITRITISDDFSQDDIGSDQAEAVTKEGKLINFFFISFGLEME